MSRLFLCFLLSLFLNIGTGNELSLQAPQGATPEARGLRLARQIEDRDQGRDARLSMRMRLFDRQNRVRERALTLLALRGGPGRPADGDRTLVRFTYPNDIKGTGFLVWEHPAVPGGDDERFLYLPSLGRVRRIAGSESQESFVGSDFTYEDIGGRQLDDYTYRLLDTPGEAGIWTAQDGTRHPVEALESTSRNAAARFPRVVSLVRADNFVVVRAEIYNKRRELQKTFLATRVEKVDGYWTVLAMTMADTLDRTRTELVVDSAEYDVGLTADHFSRRELERGGTGAGGPRPRP